MSIGKPSRSSETEASMGSKSLLRTSTSRILKGLTSRIRERRRQTGRHSLYQMLENRHLMAGLELKGIQHNASELLVDGQTLTTAPKELVFKFDESVKLTESTLSGIQISRVGGGEGQPAFALTDLGSNSAFLVEFRSKIQGAAGNGTVVRLLSGTRPNGVPLVSVTTDNPATPDTIEPNTISITLSNDPARFSQVRDLINAVAAHPVANTLLDVVSVTGATTSPIDTRRITTPVLTLRGAVTANSASDLGTGGAVSVRFTSAFPGADGQNVSVVLQRVNVGQPNPPSIRINGTTVTVRLNSTPGSESTVADLLAAISGNPEASALVIATLERGPATTVIGNRPGAAQTIQLQNFRDSTIQPGYVGIGNAPNEVVFRFAQALPSDTYRIDIFGSGPGVLQNQQNEVFNGGQSVSQEFTLDLAPRVLAVVPEPIIRTANGLTPEVGVIEVYFSDKLDQATATRPDFYQLIFNADTLDPIDDQIVNPTQVTYSAATNIARLTFAGPLSRLRNSANELLTGTARLRVGTSQRLQTASPTAIPVNSEPGDSRATAFTIPQNLTPDVTTGVRSIRLTGTVQNENEFALNLPGAGAAGTRNIRPEDIGRSDRTVPLGAFRSGADEIDGTSTIRYKFPASFLGDDPLIPGDDSAKTYFNLISEQQKDRFREVLSVFSQYLGVQFIEDSRATGADGAFQFVVGDLFGADNRTTSEAGGLAVATRDTDGDSKDDLVVLDFQDFQQSDDDLFGAEFFRGAVFAVGQLLGYGYGDGLPGSSTQSTSSIFDQLIGTTVLGSENENGELSNAEIRIESLNAPGLTRITEVEFRQNPAAATGVPVFEIRNNRLIVTLGSSAAANRANSTRLSDLLDAAAANPLVNNRVRFTAVKGLLRVNAQNQGTDIGTAAPHLVPLINTTGRASFPSVTDIVNGQYLFRPDSTDIDMYQFTLSGAKSKVSIEAFAERMTDASLLDTHLRLYRLDGNNALVEIAQNDDYFSNDSLIEFELDAGTYFVGVSASGNNRYNPNVPGSGYGGLSQGDYQLRITTRATNATGIRKLNSTVLLDGDADGTPGGVFDFWFLPADQSTTVYVDKAAAVGGDGTLARPFRDIDDALSAASASTTKKTVRVLSNGGVDGRVETMGDNFSYQVGFAANGTPLADGGTLDVPLGVQLIVDAGAIFKMRSSRIGVGSTAPTIDRSNSSIQILGTPTLRDASGFIALDSTGQAIPGNVYFTSMSDQSIGMGSGVVNSAIDGTAGEWGGIDLRSDIDFANTSRVNRENQGVFLNHIQYADLRNGGGQVRVDGRSVVVSPIELALTRATVINSRISDSADAAIAASPDTFAESRYEEPFFQPTRAFVSPVHRVGPDLHGNTIVNNSINGLFVRVVTRTGDVLQPLTTQARFDDTDITHVLSENLTIKGTPGGATVAASAPSSLAIRSTGVVGGGQVPVGTYQYRLSFASATSESLASDPTIPVTLSATGQVQLNQLPTVASGSGFTSRRLYRAAVVNGVEPVFTLVGTLNGTDTSFIDRSATGTAAMPPVDRLVARLDASLKVDPGTVVKLSGARIDVTLGADLIAEGNSKEDVVFTGINDRRYGAGGSFDTRSFDTNSSDVRPQAGSWGGIYVGHGASASIDSAVIAGAGGTTRIEGGFASFNAIEVHQGDLRLVNSLIERNADGRSTVSDNDPNRAGRGANASGVIFVQGAQPIIVGNDITSFQGPAMTFDVNSFVWNDVIDLGRSRGAINAFASTANAGPMIQKNRLDNSESVVNGSTTLGSINGLEVRGGQVATEVVWDDVDIVHVVRDMIEVPNQYIYGGLRLQSDARGSLVVKFADVVRVVPDEDGRAVVEKAAGIVAGGTLFSAASQFVDIADRIGGSLQVIGTPDFPVVLTAITDDTIGAGFSPAGRANVDTDNNGVRQSSLTSSTVPPLPSTTLPLGQEYSRNEENGPQNTTIDNDVANNVLGYFAANNVASGASIATVNITGNDKVAPVQPLANQNINFLYETIVDVDDAAFGGAHLAPQLLSASQIEFVAQPVAGDPDRVRSSGFLNLFNTVLRPNDRLLRWEADTFFLDNRAVMYTTIRFSTVDGRSIGDRRGTLISPTVRVINRLDFNIGVAIDDVLYSQGLPGERDFRAIVLDRGTRVGFAHGGVYTEDGVNQVNASYAGWAAEPNAAFLNAANFENQGFTPAGVFQLADAPDPVFVNSSGAFGPGDLATAFAWQLNAQSNAATVTSLVELLPSDPSNPDAVVLPNQVIGIGSWDGITIREAAHDRNVGVTAEIETRFTDKVDANSVPSESQFLGELAPDLSSGDENRRLGFIVNGSIIKPSDVDVYSFIGVAGTQVWIDIDRTSSSLDTVVELIDINGVALVISDDSLAESRGTKQRIVPDPLRFAPGKAGALNLLPISATAPVSAFQDQFSTNSKDAGFRVTLPEAAGQRNLYHIRVRSSSVVSGDNASLASSASIRQGKTSGSYQLQIRLREADETVGTQIKHGDVRFAANGIQVIGGPLHSPLTGDEYETAGPNDTIAQAQPLGLFSIAQDIGLTQNIGPLASDRLAKTVGGALSSAADVDWYQFDVNYQNLTRGTNGEPLYLSTLFDIDYVDGFARGDLAIYIFNADGELVLAGSDSNVADDQPTGQSTGASDLSRGSAGNLDPFIGAAELPEGNYFIAVVNQSQIPTALDQFVTPTAQIPLLRLEPIDSVTRIAEDRIDVVAGQPAVAPAVPLLFQGNDSAIPYTLNDMTMYRLTSGNAVGLVNPFTGSSYGTIGQTANFQDFAFRSNGELFAYNLPNGSVPDTDNSYSYFRINSETGAVTPLGLSGLQTYHVVVEPDGDRVVVDSNDGFSVEGMAFANENLGFVVGNRPIDRSGPGSLIQNDYFQNIIYAIVPQTGAFTGLTAPNRQVFTFGTVTIDERANGAGTQIRERGYIETGTGTAQPLGNRLVIRDATRVNPNGGSITQIDDGDAFVLQVGAQQFRVELDSGPVLEFAVNSANGAFPVDGLTFSLVSGGITQVYELETGPVISIDAATLVDGASVTIQDSAGLSRVFEFDSNNSLINRNAIRVAFTPLAPNPAPTPQQVLTASNVIAQSLVAAMETAQFGAQGFATPGQGRVDLVGDSLIVPPTVANAGLSVSGAVGTTDPNIPGTNLIRIRENFTSEELAQAVARVTGGSVAGNRVNYRNVSTANITNLEARNFVSLSGVTGVTAGSTPVRFLVSDTAEAIAIRIEQAVNASSGLQAAGVTADAQQDIVIFQNAVLNGGNGTVDPSFSVGGVPPGGIVRGLAVLGGSLYAVSDNGGLYVINNPTATVQGPIGNYVASATDLLGLNFTGLSVGPQSLEGGRFANLLFGVTGEGDLYAFDTTGRLQPVFAGGATSINIGAGTDGIDFSTLDRNLWHTTDRRSVFNPLDPTGHLGHGINATNYTAGGGQANAETRDAVGGGRSFYFGYERQATDPLLIPRQDGQGVQGTYNFPGGAKGAIESNPFSLLGYSAADLPTLYFTYFLATDGVDSVAPGTPDQDAFRVYAITEDGVEHLLTTNNVATAAGTNNRLTDTFNDEFDDPSLTPRGDLANSPVNQLLENAYGRVGTPATDTADQIDVNVQPTFDNTNSWRQARVSLSPFAGQRNLKLRVEFSTGASFGDGTLGLRAIAGDRLTDGQTIEVGGRTFELDLGSTLSIPSGAEIARFYGLPTSTNATRVTAVVGGVTYVLSDSAARVVNTGEVRVPLLVPGDGPLSTLSATTIATRLAEAIRANGVPQTAIPFNFLTESNDELASATPLTNNGEPITGNALITGSGAFESGLDVDLYRLDIPAGSTVTIGISPNTPNAFVGNVRLFDIAGNQIGIGNTATPAVFTSATAQTIVIGFSSGTNTTYNPLVANSGDPGFTGAYNATIELESDFRVVQSNANLQITGGFAAAGGAEGLIIARGTPGTAGIPIVVDASMSAEQVAIQMQRVFAQQFSNGIASAYPVAGATITLAGLTVTNAGPFGLAGVRSSDVFGDLLPVNRNDTNPAVNGVARARANNFEGVYIDDFIIGFAERGELVTAATALTTFLPPTDPTAVVGTYQLEIRDASEYVNSNTRSVFRTFDTNDRLGDETQLVVAPLGNIIDGSTFQLSDGVNSVTFEFDIATPAGTSDGIASGRVRVGLPNLSTLAPGQDGSDIVTRAIINAINSPSVQALLNVSALGSGGVDGPLDNRINLFGTAQLTSDFTSVTSDARPQITVAPLNTVNDGDTFRLFNGVTSVTFEFDVTTEDGQSDGITVGNVRVVIPELTSLTAGDDGSARLTDAIIAAINSQPVQSQLTVRAVNGGGRGNRIMLLGDVQFDVGTSSLVSERASRRGDSNRDRSDQGIILIENSRVAFSESVGIDLNYGPTIVGSGKLGSGTGATEEDSGNINVRENPSVVRYPRNLAELNSQNLIPGVVVQSSVLAYNQVSGIEITGLPVTRRRTALDPPNANDPTIAIPISGADPVPFDRILNNTIIGGTLTLRETSPAQTFVGIEFSAGLNAFADRVVSFQPGTGLSDAFDDAGQSLGAPNATRSGIEPQNPDPATNTVVSTTSLGRGGVLTLQFVDNFLTGSGDARPDLVVFETGAIESVRVEISRDNVSYIEVGIIEGASNQIDIDSDAFGRFVDRSDERFSFVRLTDLRDTIAGTSAIGADIDAVGALSSVPTYDYQRGRQGISATNGVAPTLLNNVVANSQTGISVDSRSSLTVVGGSAYFQNDANATANATGSLPLVIPNSVDVFVDPINLVFTPRAGVGLIDSSIDSLEDRPTLATVRNSIGLPPSPIIAPRFDVNGQLRVDDPNVDTPPGIGERVFKDRGADDRGDEFGPRVLLVTPFAPEIGNNSNNAATAVGSIFDFFEIQLVDGIGPAEPSPGVGIDDSSFNSSAVLVSRDGVRLVEGEDYRVGYDASNNIVRITPIAGIWENNSTYVVRFLDRDDTLITFGGNASTFTDGQVTELRGPSSLIGRLEADLGLTITVVNDNINAVDGQIISISDGVLTSVFEINTDNLLTSTENIAVGVSVNASDEQIAAALAAAINASPLNLTATTPSLDSLGDPLQPIVQLLRARNGVTLASTLTNAIRTPDDGNSIFQVAGEVGTEFGFGLRIPADGNLVADTVVDGDVFTLSRNGVIVATFELESAGGLETEGAIAVPFTEGSPLDDLANAIVAAILQVAPTLDPVNLGEGRIAFDGDSSFALDASDSGLIAVGVPGRPAATPIAIPIDADPREVIELYANAIRSLNLAGVSIEVIGDRILLNGVDAVTGAGSVNRLYLQDRVGNLLQANSTDGSKTELTIFVGGGLDFGDAPSLPFLSTRASNGPQARIDAGFQFGTTNTPEVDAILVNGDEDDGIAMIQSTAIANSTATFTIDIEAADDRAFYVDIWVDWNGNGVFGSGEVFRYRSPNAPGNFAVLSATGTNTVSLNVPADAKTGPTYARFRLSEQANLGVNQTARDADGTIGAGEIHDMIIQVQSNPFQNSIEVADVNKSGVVTPLDALNIINLLAINVRNGGTNSIPLNPVPGYMNDILNGKFLPDVNGDGFVRPSDANQVLTILSRQRKAAGQGEGEAFVQVADGVLASSLTVATTLTESSPTPTISSTTTSLAPTTQWDASQAAPVSGSTTKSLVSQTSVFDNAGVMALDEILDDLAADDRASTSSGTSVFDEVFSGLGLGL